MLSLTIEFAYPIEGTIRSIHSIHSIERLTGEADERDPPELISITWSGQSYGWLKKVGITRL